MKYFLIIFIIILQLPLLSSDKINFSNSAVLHLKQEAKKTVKLNIAIAKTLPQWEMGLMKVKKMNEKNGMLFIFNKEDYRVFWMKDTYISLDLIFFDKNKKIVGIVENNKPMNEKNITISKKAKYVLEVNSGFAKKYKIKIGDILTFK